MRIVFYGPEGSGKGTQAKLLGDKLGLPHLVSGDLVRKYAKEDKGIVGEICREALKQGHYVADSEMYVLWKKRLKENDTKKGWIIDGFPRNTTQAKFLERKVEKYGHKLDVFIYLKVPEKVSIERLKKRARRNPDGTLHDSPQRITKRLSHYNHSKQKVLDYYQKRGILKEIDGDRSIEVIHQDIFKRINQLKKTRE